MLMDLVKKNRSYRRFYEDEKISTDTLRELVELARLSASAANLQPLRFYLSNTKETNAAIFSTLGWAGYLKSWNGPEEGERPSAYIVILKDLRVNKSPTIDEGISAQSILLGAVEKGLGGCMLGNIKRAELKESLGIDSSYDIQLVIALGKPKEQVVIEPMGADSSVVYWRSEDQVHHVPKRPLDDIIL
jgi:nitroreductase